MENLLNDKRFAHVARDPKFKRIPKHERKIKIDKRFQSMFKDEKFKVKYTVDKRGRPVNQTSTDNLKKYYDISSSEEESSAEEEESSAEQEESSAEEESVNEEGETTFKTDKSKEQKSKNNTNLKKSKDAKKKKKTIKKIDKKHSSDDDKIHKTSESSSSDTESITAAIKENNKQLKSCEKTGKKLDIDTKKELHRLDVDYARGEGILFSESSSEEESTESEDEEDSIDHNWGELDKETETTDDITHRLAVCNMDWDRIRAVDIMVLFNSFLPTGGLIESVTIYPSDFGLQRMKDEEIKGPIELTESKLSKNDESNDASDDEKSDKSYEKGNDDSKDDERYNDEDEDSDYHMEKLRQYQLNRLKYYYAVIVFDSANTANKVYADCDGLEYESSSNKLDLRFIPDNMTFDNEPKEFCNELPDLLKYKPRQFTTTALQQVKVDLTWDETNPERQEITQKLQCGKLDELDQNDLQAYLASGSSEDENEDKIKKQLDGIDDSVENDNPIDKYKLLLKSIEQTEENEKNKDVELEFTWGLNEKEDEKKSPKETVKKKEDLTPFEQYLEKRKAKKLAKKEQKKKEASRGDDEDEPISEDSVPSDVDLDDPYFAEEMKSRRAKSTKRKTNLSGESDNSEEMNRQAELELLLMDENEEDNKRHFSMKRIEEAESLTKSKKKRLTKKKKIVKDEANNDDFEVDVKDTRFNALFTSHHYNIDPADPHYRKTKGTEALIHEKLKRRDENSDTKIARERLNKDNDSRDRKVNVELNSVIKSIKRNAQKLKKKV